MSGPARRLTEWKGAPWVGGTLLLVLGALGVFLFAGSASPAVSFDAGAFPAITQDDISFGTDDPEAVFVEYADFECPACANYAPILADLRNQYRDRARFVFRFYPLENHKYGVISSQAAYAAWQQDKFWEMHDLLYERQREWVESQDPRPFFERYAEELGLDVERFGQDMEAQQAIEFVSQQKEGGTAAGVSHTPFFVMDGAPVPEDDYGDLKTFFAAALP